MALSTMVTVVMMTFLARALSSSGQVCDGDGERFHRYNKTYKMMIIIRPLSQDV